MDKQVTVRSLSKKLLYSEITPQEYKTLFDWLDQEDNIFIFFEELTEFRTLNKPLNENIFPKVTEIFKKVLEKMTKKHNKILERNILILSETFCKEEDNKSFISAEIKSHKIFNDKIFWENVLEQVVKETIEKQEGKINKKYATIISLYTIFYTVKSFVNDTNEKKEIIKALLKKGQIDDKKEIETLLNLCNS